MEKPYHFGSKMLGFAARLLVGRDGGVSEWSIELVSKTSKGESSSGVRISPPPPRGVQIFETRSVRRMRKRPRASRGRLYHHLDRRTHASVLRFRHGVLERVFWSVREAGECRHSRTLGFLRPKGMGKLPR